MATDSAFPTVARHRRMQLGLSARAVSLQANQSASYMSKIESGQVEPSFLAFARLVTTLKFSPAEIALVVALEAQRGNEVNEDIS